MRTTSTSTATTPTTTTARGFEKARSSAVVVGVVRLDGSPLFSGSPEVGEFCAGAAQWPNNSYKVSPRDGGGVFGTLVTTRASRFGPTIFRLANGTPPLSNHPASFFRIFVVCVGRGGVH